MFKNFYDWFRKTYYLIHTDPSLKEEKQKVFYFFGAYVFLVAFMFTSVIF